MFDSIEVKPEIEPYKRKLLIPMVVNAVSRCLQQATWNARARSSGNKYYPRGLVGQRGMGAGIRPPSPRAAGGGSENAPAAPRARQTFAQGFCANLPASWISDLSSGSSRQFGGFSGRA